jgi:hypothetical protein
MGTSSYGIEAPRGVRRAGPLVAQLLAQPGTSLIEMVTVVHEQAIAALITLGVGEPE